MLIPSTSLKSTGDARRCLLMGAPELRCCMEQCLIFPADYCVTTGDGRYQRLFVPKLSNREKFYVPQTSSGGIHERPWKFMLLFKHVSFAAKHTSRFDDPKPRTFNVQLRDISLSRQRHSHSFRASIISRSQVIHEEEICLPGQPQAADATQAVGEDLCSYRWRGLRQPWWTLVEIVTGAWRHDPKTRTGVEARAQQEEWPLRESRANGPDCGMNLAQS